MTTALIDPSGLSREPERVSNGRFKPGQSGNPGGWPRGLESYLRDELKKLRVKVADLEGNDQVVDGYRAMFQRLISIAMHGQDKDSLVAIKLLYERTYGLPKQKIAIDDHADDDDESDLEGLSIDELRVLAKVRSAAVTRPASDEDVH